MTEPEGDARTAKADVKAAKARAKALRPWYRKKRTWLGGIIVLIIVTGIASNSGTKSPGTTNAVSNQAAPTTSTNAANTYAIGQVARTGGFSFIVYGVSDPDNAGAFPAPAGQHFVTVDLQVTNDDNKAEMYSSLLGLHLLDSQNHQYSESPGVRSPSPPDGEMSAGQSVRGFVTFEVPDGTVPTAMRVQGNITAAGAIIALQ